MGNIKDRLTEIATAAGIVILLTTADASAQDKKPLDLKTVQADSISITVPDGRIVFNQASAASATTAASAPAQTATASARRRGAQTSDAAETQPETQVAGSRRSRTQPTEPQSSSVSTTITNVEDCVTISSNFVKQATTVSETSPIAARRGRNAQAGASATNQAAAQSYIATCFNRVDGQEIPVAKITYSGTNAPVIELITPEAGK